MRRFEFSTGDSDKFWEIAQNGTEVTVNFGRIGTKGQSQTKSYDSEEAAKGEHDKLINEKTKKGYIEIKAGIATASSTQPSGGKRSVDSLKSVLKSSGVDLSAFESVELDLHDEETKKRADDMFYMSQIPKTHAMKVWKTLRESVPETGFWPVFTEEPYQELFELFMEDNEEDPAMILKHATKVDARKWFKERIESEEDVEGGDDDWRPQSEAQNEAVADDFHTVTSNADKTITMLFVPTKTPWHVTAVLKWGGSNDGHEPFEHAAIQKYWNEKYGTEPVCATISVLEYRVARPPKTREEAMQLALEQYLYCPDIVDQGCGSITGLASELIHSPRWFFWWD